MSAIVHVGNVLDILPTLEAGSVNCVVTSPPYWGLRDYGVDGQLGLEATPEEYVASLVAVFREVRRVLRDDGTLWLNLGDAYCSGTGKDRLPTTTAGARVPSGWSRRSQAQRIRPVSGLKPKDLVGTPWRVALALQADGWYLRNSIIWNKPNPMPESVTDRCTSSHEYVFLLTKAARYWYDAEAIREADDGQDHRRTVLGGPSLEPSGGLRPEHSGIRTPGGRNGQGRNRRDVWTIATQPYPGAHFATFPEKLVEPCVLAGCPAQVCTECGMPWERVVESFDTGERAKMPDGWATYDGGHGSIHHDGREKGESEIPVMGKRTLGWQPTCPCNAGIVAGIVADFFVGSGTTGAVACRLGRNFVGIELSPEYAEMAERRIAPHRDQMQLEVTP